MAKRKHCTMSSEAINLHIFTLSCDGCKLRRVKYETAGVETRRLAHSKTCPHYPGKVWDRSMEEWVDACDHCGLVYADDGSETYDGPLVHRDNCPVNKSRATKTSNNKRRRRLA